MHKQKPQESKAQREKLLIVQTGHEGWGVMKGSMSNYWFPLLKAGSSVFGTAVLNWMCASHPKFICWNPNPKVMVLGCGVFGRYFGHERRTFNNGISALIGKRQKNSFPSSYHMKIQWEVGHRQLRRALTRTGPWWHPHLSLLASRTERN